MTGVQTCALPIFSLSSWYLQEGIAPDETVDNRAYPVSHGASFTVERAEQTIFLAVPHNISFYDTLRNKMMWGIDIRS